MILNQFLKVKAKVLFILRPTKVKTRLTNTFEDKSLSDLLNDEYRILQNDLNNESLPETVIKALDKAKKRVEAAIEKLRKQKDEDIAISSVLTGPSFPYETGPRDYQQKAFENWKNNKQKGLFAMATGTGKTITSLNCLLEIYKRFGYYKAMILVPTITLVDQWEVECKKFNFDNIIKVSSKSRNWKSSVANLRMLEMSKADDKLSYIIIVTYASFVRSNIFPELNKFPKQKLLLIADEAHNMGSGQMINRLNEIPYLRRIGLSATPERQYDENGNQKLMNFFGCTDNYTFEYSMAEAIEKGALCRYYYYPHVGRLTETEMEQYVDISAKIVKMMGFKDAESQEILQRLLLKRKRIIHKAENKKLFLKKLLKTE
jgi:superfamily II DNA or RNA helicase